MEETYLAVSLARMAALRSVLILERRAGAGASVEVEDQRKLGAVALELHRGQSDPLERSCSRVARIVAIVCLVV